MSFVQNVTSKFELFTNALYTDQGHRLKQATVPNSPNALFHPRARRVISQVRKQHALT
jgi:hypothetical protein